MSATPDSALADCSRTIADLQRELAECKAERDAALVREAATAEVLQVINSLSGDLAPVFDAILEKAHNLCDAAHGALMIFDGECFRAIATRGHPESFADFLRCGGPIVPGSPLEPLAQREHFVHIPDLAALAAEGSEAFTRGVRAAVELGGTRTLLVVPLRKDGALLGYIAVTRREVRPFTDEQIALLQNFAAQAVIAMENARLLTETREALEQQTATAEVLQVINSSPGNLVPVFDAMLDKALRLCEAACGNLLVFDGRLFSFASVQGEPDLVEHMRRREPFEPLTGTALDRIVEGEDFAHIADLLKSHEYRSVPQFRELVDIGGYRSLFEFALRKDKALLGVIAIFRREARPFTEKQIALLQNFAAQAVIAMENARLLTETREALEQQTATAEVLQVINSSPGDLAPVFEAMLEKATSLCGAAFGLLFTWEGECFHPVAWRGISRELLAVLREPFRPQPGTLTGHIARGENIVSNADLLQTAAYRSGIARVRALVEFGGARSHIGVALRKDDAVLGHLSIYRQEVRPFTNKEIALLQDFAAQAVIAMENARLIGELRERTEEIAELNRGLEARVAEQVEEWGGSGG